MESLQRRNYRVSGRVQGVFYRASTERQAKLLGLCGTVRNLDDGSVLVQAEGTAAQLDDLQHWLKQGPPMAAVQEVTVEVGEVEGFREFRVLR